MIRWTPLNVTTSGPTLFGHNKRLALLIDYNKISNKFHQYFAVE